MNLNLSSTMSKAEELLKQTEKDDILAIGDEALGLEDYMLSVIKANLCSTVRVRYNASLGEVLVDAAYPSGIKLSRFQNMSEELYWDFCKSILNLDMEEEYNCSRSLNIDGVRTRCYAVMPPLSEYPQVTISTTKEPPATLDKQTISDELLNEIIHDNFIIVGASGSGKTYLLNYMLNKFIRNDERIGIIEEFSELIPPNDLCSSLICPPPKPNKQSLLRFMTEQSNLMRLDAIYVGEIKGAEAWPFVVNLASGTRGACTMHGDSAQHALSRLRALCQLSTENADAINEFIAKSIRYIIVMKNHAIVNIYKLTGTVNRNNFAMQEIGS